MSTVNNDEKQKHVYALEVPRTFETAVDTLKSQVETLRYLCNGKQKRVGESSLFELEIRMGTVENGSFLSGVSQTDFDHIHGMLTQGSWTNNPDWYKYTDYFYKTNVYNQDIDMRTTVNESFKTDEQSQHIIKRHLSKYTFATNSYAIRSSLSQEMTPSAAMIPDVVDHYTYRKKSRKDFKTTNWCYSLSQVQYPKCNTTHYEVEIECTDPQKYLAEEYHSDEYVALSLLMKIMQLMDTESHITPLGF